MIWTHGAVIEQAKGALMEREGLDAATAYERLRTAARSSSRKVADVARDLLALQLPQEQIEQHGTHDRGDEREQDHQ